MSTIAERFVKLETLLPLLYGEDSEEITPIALAKELVSDIPLSHYKDSSAFVVDPCCGRGTILVAYLHRGFILLEKSIPNEQKRIEYLISKVYGCDMNPAMVDNCKSSLYNLVGRKVSLNIITADAFKHFRKENMPKFDWEIGNYPFNDDSSKAGRDTNKLKENTKNLDQEFYGRPLASNRAVILRSNCLAKNSDTRKNIFTDSQVCKIKNTTNYFNVTSRTMAVFRFEGYCSSKKTIIDTENREWFVETDENTKLSLDITAKGKTAALKIQRAAEQSSFGDHWVRGAVKKTDKRVNDNKGIPFVKTTGPADEELELFRFNGPKHLFPNIDKWRAIVNSAGRSCGNSLGAIKKVRPGIATSESIIELGAAATEEEIDNIIDYLNSPAVSFATDQLKVAPSNSREFFYMIPWFDFTSPVSKRRFISRTKLNKKEESIVYG